MSFLVIITSLITFMILIIIDFIDRNQKEHVDIIQYIRSVSIIGTYLKQLSVYRNIGIISYQSSHVQVQTYMYLLHVHVLSNLSIFLRR